MAEGTWLTRVELAARLGVTEGTVRNWRRRYADLIPSAYGPDGIRRYALRPFELIAAMRKRKRSFEDIRAALAEDGEPEPEGYEARLIAVLARIADAAERIADVLDRPAQG